MGSYRAIFWGQGQKNCQQFQQAINNNSIFSGFFHVISLLTLLDELCLTFWNDSTGLSIANYSKAWLLIRSMPKILVQLDQPWRSSPGLDMGKFGMWRGCIQGVSHDTRAKKHEDRNDFEAVWLCKICGVGMHGAVSRCCSSRHFYAFVWYCQVSITSDDVEQFSALVSPKNNEHAKNIQIIQKILRSFITRDI